MKRRAELRRMADVVHSWRGARLAVRGGIATLALACVGSLGLASASVAAAQPEGDEGAPQAEEMVYPEAPEARNFNSGPAGWESFQEWSAGCWLRGGTCTKLDGEYQADGGQAGAGDGFLRFNGNSAAIYPFPWGQGAYAHWDSPMFTYQSEDAKSWKLRFDWRSSKANYALGWNGIQVEIRNADGEIVRTAVPAQVSVPTNAWRSFEIPFDGSRETFEEGEQYYISIVAIDYYGPSAASLGYHDIDNVEMVTSTAPPEPGAQPHVQCNAAEDVVSGLGESIQEVLTLKPQSLCPLVEPVGDEVSPIVKIADKIANSPGISDLLDRGDGAFLVVDNAVGQATAWFAGRDHTLPSVDPRKLYVWTQSGGAGHAAAYALVFVTYQPEQVIDGVLNHPGGVPGAVMGAVEGQLGAATDVLSDPQGEALDVDLDWSIDNVMWHVSTVLKGLGQPIDVPELPGAGQRPESSDLPTTELPLPVAR